MHRAIKFRITYQHDETGRITMRFIELGDAIPSPGDRWAVVGKDQFTGLTDKNGKEIYEGDIVKTGGDLKPMPVIFEGGAFLIAGIGYYLNKARVSEWFIEVIGNIYEHPELLNAD